MKRIAVTTLVVIPALTVAAGAGHAKEFTEFSTAVNLGPTINSLSVESCVAISKNGLSLYFSSNRQSPSDPIDRDLYVSQRSSLDEPWGPPIALTMLNSTTWDSCPQLSPDEHRLYFTTRRAPTCGLEDIWVSHRQDRRDDLAWEPPVSLGCVQDGGLNSAGRDLAETIFEDEAGNEVMYFCRTNPAKPVDLTTSDVYRSEMQGDGSFGPPELVPELSSSFADMGIAVSRDGLEAFLLSGRPHGGVTPSQTYLDFWRTTRASTRDPWSPPTFEQSLGDPALASGHISLSFDGRDLYFSSTRGGSADLWVAHREPRKAREGRQTPCGPLEGGECVQQP